MKSGGDTLQGQKEAEAIFNQAFTMGLRGILEQYEERVKAGKVSDKHHKQIAVNLRDKFNAIEEAIKQGSSSTSIFRDYAVVENVNQHVMEMLTIVMQEKINETQNFSIQEMRFDKLIAYSRNHIKEMLSVMQNTQKIVKDRLINDLANEADTIPAKKIREVEDQNALLVKTIEILENENKNLEFSLITEKSRARKYAEIGVEQNDKQTALLPDTLINSQKEEIEKLRKELEQTLSTHQKEKTTLESEIERYAKLLPDMMSKMIDLTTENASLKHIIEKQDEAKPIDDIVYLSSSDTDDTDTDEQIKALANDVKGDQHEINSFKEESGSLMAELNDTLRSRTIDLEATKKELLDAKIALKDLAEAYVMLHRKAGAKQQILQTKAPQYFDSRPDINSSSAAYQELAKAAKVLTEAHKPKRSPAKVRQVIDEITFFSKEEPKSKEENAQTKTDSLEKNITHKPTD